MAMVRVLGSARSNTASGNDFWGSRKKGSLVIIDCDSCEARGLACSDCVVSVLLGPPTRLDGDQREAIEALSEAGMVPPLRLVLGRNSPDSSGYGLPRNTRAEDAKGLLRGRSAG